MTFRDDARFYRIDDLELPSVTTVIGVINKPALVPWAANAERRAFEAAMLAVAAQYALIPADVLLDRVIEAVSGVKAAEREKQEAATIGTAVHAWISWQLRRELSDKPGPEPPLSDAAAWAAEAWKDWARSVDLVPIAIERVVYCQACGYAGTMDLYARVNGVLTVLDWKSGRAIYPEAFLQNVAYRHAARVLGMPSDQGLVVRLPKLIDDPLPEVMPVPETVMLEEFLAARDLWQWQRRMQGRRTEAHKIARHADDHEHRCPRCERHWLHPGPPHGCRFSGARAVVCDDCMGAAATS